MSVIEGIGDEVLVCVVVFLVIVLLVLAWASTFVQDNHQILGRVSIIIERRRDSQSNPSQGASESTEQVEEAQARTTEVAETAVPNEPTEKEENEPLPNASESVPPPPSSSVKDGNEELRLWRLKHFQSKGEEPGEGTQEREETSDTAEPPKESKEDKKEKKEEESGGSSGLESITIKLKYLNDTQRLVDGRLEEKLGDFKQRHFAMDLSENKLVKLIFNGRLLRSDTETLRSCGLFDQCVIHCHVAQPPARPPSEPFPDQGGLQHELDLDLGHLMLPLFCILLAIVWFCWFEFGQFFNATATVALIGITGLMVITLIALYTPLPGERGGLFDLNFMRRN